MTKRPVLRVRNLRTAFGSGGQFTEVVKGVSFDLAEGEVLGLIGESGSGKTVTGLSVLRLLPENARVTADKLVFQEQSLGEISANELRAMRGVALSMIFQDPVGSFNPAKTIGWHIESAISIHSARLATPGTQFAYDLLHQVNIRDPERVLNSYPHQLSGGMLQRTLIAMVFGLNPRLVVADEPTTNLDNIVERQILDLIRRQKEIHRTSVIFITHDLTVARHLCDRVAVMYGGKIVEIGPTEEILSRPAHPYTIGLLKTALSLETQEDVLYEIKGEPGAISWVRQCAFSPRCQRASDLCTMTEPTVADLTPNRQVQCYHYDS